MKCAKFFLAFIFFAEFFSCSLDYGKKSAAENLFPEINFSDATMKRIENQKLSVELTAQRLEQYKNGDFSYAEGIQFRTIDDDGDSKIEGECDLLAANPDKKNYSLFGAIRIKVLNENLEFHAENLMWNGKREQLVSGRDDDVTILRDDVVISGRGFSASGVSKTFSFEQDAQGEYNDKNDPENLENENAQNTESEDFFARNKKNGKK